MQTAAAATTPRRRRAAQTAEDAERDRRAEAVRADLARYLALKDQCDAAYKEMDAILPRLILAAGIGREIITPGLPTVVIRDLFATSDSFWKPVKCSRFRLEAVKAGRARD